MRIFKVQGKGRVNVEPDLITLSFEIENNDEDYAESFSGLNVRVEDLRASMASAGLERTELKTTDFTVQVEQRYDEESKEYFMVGYRASHNLHIELPLEKTILNQVLRHVAQGHSGAEIGLTFSVKDKDGLRKRALAEAVRTAKDNAEALAVAAGVNLGKLLELDYGWAEVRVHNRSANIICESKSNSMARYDLDIEPADVSAEDNVTLVFEIAD